MLSRKGEQKKNPRLGVNSLQFHSCSSNKHGELEHQGDYNTFGLHIRISIPLPSLKVSANSKNLMILPSQSFSLVSSLSLVALS